MTTQGSAAEARVAHTHEVAGSIPAPATHYRIDYTDVLLFNALVRAEIATGRVQHRPIDTDRVALHVRVMELGL